MGNPGSGVVRYSPFAQRALQAVPVTLSRVLVVTQRPRDRGSTQTETKGFHVSSVLKKKLVAAALVLAIVAVGFLGSTKLRRSGDFGEGFVLKGSVIFAFFRSSVALSPCGIRCDLKSCSSPVDPPLKDLAMDRVAVSNQEPWCFVLQIRLDNRLRCPEGRAIRRHVAADAPLSVMANDKKAESIPRTLYFQPQYKRNAAPSTESRSRSGDHERELPAILKFGKPHPEVPEPPERQMVRMDRTRRRRVVSSE